MKTYLKSFARLTLGLLLGCALYADPLTLNSPGVVGTLDGKLANNSVDNQIVAAQHLLDMGANTVDPLNAALGLYYRTSSTEYSGVLTGGTPIVGDVTAESGWEFAFVKYDGKQAGYVLFYLGGAAANTLIPNFPADLWTTETDQFQISGVTYFNQVSVPEGGSTAILLGLGFLGIGLLRRMFA